MRTIYSLLVYILTPFALIRLYWRGRKAPLYRKRWKERFAYITVPKEYQQGIWIHLASLGETIAATPLIKALQKQYPDLGLILTTMTPTGSVQVQKTFGDTVYHVYVPYDLPSAVHRFIDQSQPKLAILMETELWPNLIAECQKRGIPTLLANARLSAQSAKGYRRFAWITQPMLQSLTAIAAQAKPDAERLIDIGGNPNSTHVCGNLKFDFELPQGLSPESLALKNQFQGRPIWIAASTHPGEETILLDALKLIKAVSPHLVLALAPRHPERFDAIAKLASESGFNLIRRTKTQDDSLTKEFETADIYLIDTTGELKNLFGAAEIAFIGGSLIPHGGHNLLEPCAFGLPVLSGPHVHNFTEVARLLNEANALITVKNADEIAEKIILLLQNSQERSQKGKAGLSVIKQNRGALEKHLAGIASLLRHGSWRSHDFINQ